MRVTGNEDMGGWCGDTRVQDSSLLTFTVCSVSNRWMTGWVCVTRLWPRFAWITWDCKEYVYRVQDLYLVKLCKGSESRQLDSNCRFTSLSG